MRIEGVRSRVVAFPLEAPFLPAWGRGRVQSTLELVIYEVVTDDGLVGVGAASGGLANAVAMDRLVTPHLIGQDPTDIERLAGIIRDAEIMGPPPRSESQWRTGSTGCGKQRHRNGGLGRPNLKRRRGPTHGSARLRH